MITLEPPRGVPEGVEGWRTLGLSRARMSRFATTARAAVGLTGTVDVLLTTDAVLRRLNREYRGKDKATDVLSFPAAQEIAEQHAGDLAISLQTAARQGDEHGHSLESEVRVLLLHGLLHLSGMDHKADRGEMAAREAELRVKFRLPQGLIGRTMRIVPAGRRIAVPARVREPGRPPGNSGEKAQPVRSRRTAAAAPR